jgi:DNA-binding NtrC family response regulator
MAMIIEDEKDLCHLLAILLKQNKVLSACVHSIREAREAIIEVKPSIIFLDNHLPDGKGSDFIPQAKAMYPSSAIIMITAHDGPAEIDTAFQRGADYFISKPFNASVIKKTLEMCLKKEQMRVPM